MAPPRKALVGHLLQGLGSQGLSSISNFALVVVVARAATPQEFGAFAVSYSVLQLLVGATRGAVGETVAVTPRSDRRYPAVVGAAAVIGMVAGAAVCAVGATWPASEVARWLLLIGVAVPVIVVQDAARSIGFATHRPSVAVAADGTWVVLQVAGWIALAMTGLASPAAMFAVWLVAAGAGFTAVAPAVGWPRLRLAGGWLRTNARLGTSFGVDSAMYLGAAQATVWAVGAAAGLPAAGALRAAQSLYGPLRSLGAGILSVSLPEASRRLAEQGRGAMIRYSARVSAGLTVAAALGVAVLVWLPQSIGMELLADTWPAAAAVLLPVGLSVVAGMAATGARLGLRALHATAATLWLRSAATVATLALGVGGALSGGAMAAAWGLAIAQVSASVMAWGILLRRAT